MANDQWNSVENGSAGIAITDAIMYGHALWLHPLVTDILVPITVIIHRLLCIFNLSMKFLFAVDSQISGRLLHYLISGSKSTSVQSGGGSLIVRPPNSWNHNLLVLLRFVLLT